MRIRDIATKAHVSPATVSRYLNGHFDAMSHETRLRIASVIEQTGYRPSQAARSLRTAHSGMVGVVLADLSNPYSGSILEELDAQAALEGMSLLTATSDNDPEREHAALERLINAGVDGLIVNTCSADTATLRRICQGVPLVLLDRDTAPAEFPLVTSNNTQLTRGLVDELRNSLCTQFYLLNERNTSSSVRHARAQSFSDELAQHQLTGNVVALESDPNTACRQLQHLWDTTHATPHCKKPPRLGLIAINGLVFLRLVEALAQCHLQVPRQVCVATFDDYAWNHVLYGGVTTAVQDTHAIAREALNLLFHAIPSDNAAQTPRVSSHIPGTIIVRATTQP